MNTLKLNSDCPDVLFLQGRLGLKTDGSFGPKTEEAVKEYQASKGLVADGIVGAKTWATFQTPILSEKDYQEVADLIGCDVEAVKAIKTVESGGQGFAEYTRPPILFEGHIFWGSLVKHGLDPKNYQKAHPGIVYSGWDRSKYKGGLREYDRLEEAWKIHKQAALESASMGLFQIMGNNYKLCGEDSPFSMWSNASLSEGNQLRQFGNFIINSRIAPYLIAHDWEKVAYRYNGAGYKKNKYDTKLRDAYNKFKGN